MVLRKAGFKAICILNLVVLLLSVGWQQATVKAEAQASGWSVAQTIPGYDRETWPPVLVADQNRTVHAFTSQPVDTGQGELVQAVFYNRWTLQQGWTFPTDILLSPIKDAQATDAILDGNGTLHVVFFGGDNTGADIYYSKAPEDRAEDPSAWSAPVLIGENAGDPAGAVFYQDTSDTLYVMYYGRQMGNGLYVVSSKDHGDSWSDPTNVFLTSSDTPNISQLHVTKDQSGWFHAIWAVYTATAQGRGIYYARSKDGVAWEDTIELANAPEGFGTQAPTIVVYEDTLIALYIMTPKIMMRRSTDSGKTWDAPSVVFPRHVGVNGSLSLVIDSKHDLNLFFGQRITGSAGSPDIHGMWHSTYRDNRWAEPDAVISGPLVRDPVHHTGFDPFEAHSIVSQGNTILVTWMTEVSAGFNGVWYSYEKLDAPELPIVELPAARAPNDSAMSVFVTPTSPASVAEPISGGNLESDGAASLQGAPETLPENPSGPILLGTISAALVALVVIGLHIVGRNN